MSPAGQASAGQASAGQASAGQASAGQTSAGQVPAGQAPAEPAPPGGAAVGIVMGSDSDWPVMRAAAEALDEFGVGYEVRVLSAHRTPQRMLDWAAAAAGRGLRVVVAGAGGAAHLPGMVAAATVLPVIGVPVPLAHLNGVDSLLSIVQMPAGVPVATVSIGGSRNAGLLAVRILAAADPALAAAMARFQQDLADLVTAKDEALAAGLHAGDRPGGGTPA